MASRVKQWWGRRWAPTLSAFLLILAFPPFDFWPLVFVALTPLLWHLKRSDRKEAWRSGYFFGWIFVVTELLWLFTLAVTWTHQPLLALVPWLLGVLYVSLYFGWAGVLLWKCLDRKWYWLIPVGWTGIEVARSYIPVLAFPWGLMGTPLYKVPALIQTAHYGTIYFVSAWIVLVNVVLLLLIDRETRSSTRPYFGAALLLLAASLGQYGQPFQGTKFPVTIAQPGVNMAFGNPETAPFEAARNINGFTASALVDGSKLMVLPEGAVRGDDYPPQPLFQFDRRLPLIFGGQRGKGPTYQSAFGYDGEWHYEDKTRLVIFGEFVPGRSTFPFIAKAFDLPTKDLDASSRGIQAVDVGGIRVGPMLCFEGLFPEVSFQQARNGSKMIAVMCIDDWYMGTTAPEQLRAAATFRAVETGLPLVRSASMGWTLALDAHGNVLAQLPLKEPGALRVDLELPEKSPLFPLLPAFPVLALLSVPTIALWRRRPKAS